MVSLFLLAGLCMVVSASDKAVVRQCILKKLSVVHLYDLQEIDASNKKFDSDDFALLLSMATDAESINVSGNLINCFRLEHQYDRIKKLNLSNNNFTGIFPLNRCLQLFPNLEELVIDGNKVTRLSEEGGISCSNKLRYYGAQNTHCADINLRVLYEVEDLEQLNVSKSTQLKTFSGLKDSGFKKIRGRSMLRVIVDEVDQLEDSIGLYTKRAVTNTDAAECIDAITIPAAIVGTLAFELPCLFVQPYYCLLCPFSLSALAGLGVVGNIFLTMGGSSCVIACTTSLLAKVIAYQCLKNHGKQQVIEFVVDNKDTI